MAAQQIPPVVMMRLGKRIPRQVAAECPEECECLQPLATFVDDFCRLWDGTAATPLVTTDPVWLYQNVFPRRTDIDPLIPFRSSCWAVLRSMNGTAAPFLQLNYPGIAFPANGSEPNLVVKEKTFIKVVTGNAFEFISTKALFGSGTDENGVFQAAAQIGFTTAPTLITPATWATSLSYNDNLGNVNSFIEDTQIPIAGTCDDAQALKIVGDANNIQFFIDDVLVRSFPRAGDLTAIPPVAPMPLLASIVFIFGEDLKFTGTAPTFRAEDWKDVLCVQRPRTCALVFSEL